MLKQFLEAEQDVEALGHHNLYKQSAVNLIKQFKHFFETLRQSLLFLSMIIFQLCVGYFIVMTIPTESLNSIVEIILLITTFAFAIFSIMLFFILKIKNS